MWVRQKLVNVGMNMKEISVLEVMEIQLLCERKSSVSQWQWAAEFSSVGVKWWWWARAVEVSKKSAHIYKKADTNPWGSVSEAKVNPLESSDLLWSRCLVGFEMFATRHSRRGQIGTRTWNQTSNLAGILNGKLYVISSITKQSLAFIRKLQQEFLKALYSEIHKVTHLQNVIFI